MAFWNGGIFLYTSSALARSRSWYNPVTITMSILMGGEVKNAHNLMVNASHAPHIAVFRAKNRKEEN